MLPVGAVSDRAGAIVTNRDAVATAFGKRHDNILRDIKAHLFHPSNLRDGTEGWFIRHHVATATGLDIVDGLGDVPYMFL